MGLLDKAKAQAEQLAQKAQESVKVGQAKVEELQAKRRTEGLLRDLGAAAYAEKTGTGTAETAAEIERLVSELRRLEAEEAAEGNGPSPTTNASGAEGPA